VASNCSFLALHFPLAIKFFLGHGSRRWKLRRDWVNIFEDLMAEKEPLCKAVARLNTIRNKRQQHISLVAVPEDGVAE
jgi:hypothetical protein